jgi:hypothetical protein
MLKRPQALRAVFLAAAVAMGLSPRASAVDFTWSAYPEGIPLGGSGDWDTTSQNWIDALLGSGGAAWDNNDPGEATVDGVGGVPRPGYCHNNRVRCDIANTLITYVCNLELSCH